MVKISVEPQKISVKPRKIQRFKVVFLKYQMFQYFYVQGKQPRSSLHLSSLKAKRKKSWFDNDEWLLNGKIVLINFKINRPSSLKTLGRPAVSIKLRFPVKQKYLKNYERSNSFSWIKYQNCWLGLDLNVCFLLLRF